MYLYVYIDICIYILSNHISTQYIFSLNIYIAALSKLGFCEVIFGCDNDRFGGNGSILSIHTIGSQSHSYSQVASSSINISSSSSYKSDNSSNHKSSLAITSTSTTSASISIDSLAQYSSSQYHAYPVRRGVLKEEAIAIFQKFYLSENRRAPESKRKRKALRILSNHKQDNNDITNATLTTATNSTNI